MALFSMTFSFISIYLNFYALVKFYSKLGQKQVKINYILIFILSFIMLAANIYLPDVPKIFTSFLCILFLFKITFNDELFSCLIKFLITYLTLAFIDYACVSVAVFFPNYSKYSSSQLFVISMYCTFADALFLLLIVYLDVIMNFIRKFVMLVIKSKNKFIALLSFFAFVIILYISYININHANIDMFIISTLLLSFAVLVIILAIFEYFKSKRIEEEQKRLLVLMEEYERVLDKDRINRHEMFNNLVVLKSYKNKSSVEFDDMIDDLIKTYSNKESRLYSKLYQVPKGIKGAIYLKLADIRVNNIDLNLFIEPKIDDKFNQIDAKLYYNVCKILGILFDNAVEATMDCGIKYIVLDIYSDDSTLYIYIENTFNNDVNLDTINIKGYSTKGDNRGYGLYIVDKIVQESNKLKLERNITNNKFITILEIKQ